VIGPFAAVAFDGDAPVAGLAARLELRRLEAAVGYRVLYAPDVRALQVVDGGLAGDAAPLAGALGRALEHGEADVVLLPPLERGSGLEAAFASLGGRFDRQPLIAPWTRRLLRLPGSFEEYLASRSHRTRKGIRQEERKLAAAFGDRLSIERLDQPADLERLVAAADRVAGAAYQRGLGGGFADTPEQRELTRVGLEHGWLAGYLLFLDDRPIAYWLCSAYNSTILLRTGGYDPAYAEHRPGIHLLMRAIADACDDPALETFDFGPGDAAYKQQFSNASRVERNAVIFAPSFRARRINAARTAILVPTRAARVALDTANLTSRVRSRLRR
jgi:CelD/BcsL family acetyltransferase involved in cellulose biosynthesis